MGPHRYTDRPFPSYRFVPGKAPHPTRDQDGHSYNEPPVQLAPFDPHDWYACEEYLYGIDLFNHGYWWEAHEALEAVWAAAGRRTETGLFIKGLIQIAAAHLKRSQGFHDAATRMAARGLEKVKHTDGIFVGIDVAPFRHDVESYFSGENEMPVIIELITASRERKPIAKQMIPIMSNRGFSSSEIRLRDVQARDLKILFEHQRDPIANDMAAFAARDWDDFLGHWTRKILGDDTVIKKTILSGDEVVGYITCFEKSGKRLVGYWIGQEFWGKGIASRALPKFIAGVNARPLHAYVAKHNVRSIRVLEKCGFIVTGEGTVTSNTGGEAVEEFIFTLSE